MHAKPQHFISPYLLSKRRRSACTRTASSQHKIAGVPASLLQLPISMGALIDTLPRGQSP